MRLRWIRWPPNAQAGFIFMVWVNAKGCAMLDGVLVFLLSPVAVDGSLDSGLAAAS